VIKLERSDSMQLAISKLEKQATSSTTPNNKMAFGRSRPATASRTYKDSSSEGEDNQESQMKVKNFTKEKNKRKSKRLLILFKSSKIANFSFP